LIKFLCVGGSPSSILEMMSMDDFDANFGPPSPAVPASQCLSVRIVRTEEQMSLIMQRFTAYIIEVNDCGKINEVPHRYSEFETLHKTLLTECVGLQLPPMPPKGADGTDSAVIAARKGELEKILKAMISAEVLMEKQLTLWKFLDLGNPSVIVGRFVMVPRARGTVLKTMAKLNDEKYKDDVYRLGHFAVMELLMEGLRELRSGSDSNHWCRQQGGRSALCQLVAGSLGTTQEARDRLIEMDVIGHLLGIVQLEENALDDARPALNVIVAREGDKLPSIVARFLVAGGLHQLVDLVQRPKCQEFVAKLLWLAWDAGSRAAFAQPGGMGLKVLQTLLRSTAPMCSLLGAVLLAGMVAGSNFEEPTHRSEALKLVRMSLERPEAANDPQFAKALCGGASALVRLAAMLEDAELAPLVLGLLCTAKPPAAKLGQISGNLAALLANKGAHTEQTRARAAELLLHIQGSGTATSAPSPVATPNGLSTGTAYGSAPAQRASSAGINELLERCEGIAAHEESMEAALRAQLEEGLAKGRQVLEADSVQVREVSELAQHRLKDLPVLDFQSFEKSFASFRAAREVLGRDMRECESLQANIDRQLRELQTARPSSVDPQLFKEKLLMAERLYVDVKSQREAFASAEADALEKTSRSEVSSSKLRELESARRRYQDDLQQLKSQRTDKELKASQIRSKADMPGLLDMKRQAQESIDRNLAEAKQLQVIGQRVQQGDPDYLREGESREQKITELTAKLAELKRQHQSLLQKQKEFDIDPVSLGDQARKLENEAAELDIRIGGLEDKLRETERSYADASGDATRDAEDARQAKERRSSLSSRLSSVEQDAKAQISALQPMIQEQHSGWQRLLSQQKKLDEYQHSLMSRLNDAKTAAASEVRSREHVAGAVQDLVKSLLGFASFLDQCGGEPLPTAAPLVPAEPSPSAAMLNSFEDDWQATPPLTAAPAAPAVLSPPSVLSAPVAAVPMDPAPVAAPKQEPAPLADDDFDAFLKEDLSAGFGVNGQGGAEKPPDDL